MDLTPTLMTIYDTFSTTPGKSVTFAPCDDAIPNGFCSKRSSPGKENLSKSCVNVSCSVVDENENVESSGRTKRHLFPKKMAANGSAPMEDGQGGKTYWSGAEGPRLCSNGSVPRSAFQSETAMEIQNDAKKRPLSISSTTSSTSSTSSLPRHQKKKVATSTTATTGITMATEQDLSSEDADSSRHYFSRDHSRYLPDIPSDQSLHEDDLDTSPIRHHSRKDTSNSSNLSESAMSLNKSGICSSHSSSILNDSSSSAHGLSDHYSGILDTAGCIFSPPSPHPQARFLFDMSGASYIERVVAEIIETERTYVRDLQDIIHVSTCPSTFDGAYKCSFLCTCSFNTCPCDYENIHVIL